jgi:hypothetical protein
MLKIYEGTWKRRATLWVADHSCRKMSKEAVDVLIHKHSYTCDSCARCDPASRCQHEKTPPGAEKTSCARQSVKTEHVDVWNMWNVWNHPASSNKHIKTLSFLSLCPMCFALSSFCRFASLPCVLCSAFKFTSRVRDASGQHVGRGSCESGLVQIGRLSQLSCSAALSHLDSFLGSFLCDASAMGTHSVFSSWKIHIMLHVHRIHWKRRRFNFLSRYQDSECKSQIRIDSNCIVAPGLVASLTYCSTWKLSRFSAGLGELQA